MHFRTMLISSLLRSEKSIQEYWLHKKLAAWHFHFWHTSVLSIKESVKTKLSSLEASLKASRLFIFSSASIWLALYFSQSRPASRHWSAPPATRQQLWVVIGAVPLDTSLSPHGQHGAHFDLRRQLLFCWPKVLFQQALVWSQEETRLPEFEFGEIRWGPPIEPDTEQHNQGSQRYAFNRCRRWCKNRRHILWPSKSSYNSTNRGTEVVRATNLGRSESRHRKGRRHLLPRVSWKLVGKPHLNISSNRL